MAAEVFGDCPACGRTGLPADVDRQARRLWVRRHRKPDGRRWCSSKRRVDAGPAPADLVAQPTAGQVMTDAFVDGETVDDPMLTARIRGHVELLHGLGPPPDPRDGQGTSARAARRALDRYHRGGGRGLQS